MTVTCYYPPILATISSVSSSSFSEVTSAKIELRLLACLRMNSCLKENTNNRSKCVLTLHPSSWYVSLMQASYCVNAIDMLGRIRRWECGWSQIAGNNFCTTYIRWAPEIKGPYLLLFSIRIFLTFGCHASLLLPVVFIICNSCWV